MRIAPKPGHHRTGFQFFRDRKKEGPFLTLSFVAGVGRITYSHFLIYNVVGGTTWVLLFVFAGYFFGAIPVVQQNFELVIIAIIAVSLLPGAITTQLRHKIEPTPAKPIYILTEPGIGYRFNLQG